MSSNGFQYAYILHQRPFKERQLLVDLFSQATGRTRAVARLGAKRQGHAAPQVFSEYQLSISGRGELKRVNQWQASGQRQMLGGEALYAGYYINELILRLLPAEEPDAALWQHYTECLAALATQGLQPLPLRLFELQLLESLGYAPELDCDHQGQPLAAQQRYYYHPEHGLMAVAETAAGISGAAVAAMRQHQWQQGESLQAARHICQSAINGLLGERPLNSRQLFIQYRQRKHT